MSTFNWLGGAMDDPDSWGSQPDSDDPVVPGSTDLVNIAMDGDLTGSLSVLQATFSAALDLQGDITTAGFSVVSGGTLTIETGATLGGAGLVNDAAIVQLGGAVNIGASHEFLGDAAGKSGSYTQKGGTHTIAGDLAVGNPGTGMYDLQAGSLSSIAEYIGQNNTGTFTQEGGSNTVSDRVVLGINITSGANGTGSYTLGGTGDLSVQVIFIGSDPNCTGTFNFNKLAADSATMEVAGTEAGYPGLIVGGQGTGTFTQGHGALSTTVSVGFRVGGHGTYNFDNGTLTSTAEKIGDAGTGTFIQKHGTNTANGSGLDVGSANTSNGTYDLDNGTLKAQGETIGDQGVGLFTQKGGSNEVAANDLIVGNASGGNGTYSLHDGSVTIDTGALTVGAQANSTGAFDFNTTAGDAGTLTVTSHMVTIGDGGTGTFTQGDGELDANIEIGAQTGSDGTFELDMGSVVSSDGGITVGDTGTGTFTQDDGSVEIDNGNLFVGDNGGDGTYTLGGTGALAITGGDFDIAVEGGSSGKFDFNTAAGDDAALTIDSKVITVGGHGAGSFVQGGGTLNAKLVVGGQVGGHGTVELDDGVVTARGQVVGNNGAGKFTQTGGVNKISGGGDLILGAFAAGGGSYDLAGGKLSSGSELIGYAGAGHITQSAGTNTLAASNSIMDIGTQANANGAYTLRGGALKAIQEVVGDAGTGAFSQTGGTNTISGSGSKLAIGGQGAGSGSYSLVKGALKAAVETIGDGAAGGFTQKGGTNAIAGAGSILDLGAQAAGNGTYVLDKGALSATREAVGNAGTGVFTQNSGTNAIEGTLSLGVAAHSHGAYTLVKGDLTAANEIVGDAGKGRFDQTGGINQISGDLTIGDAHSGPGAYDLTGGSLTVKTVTGHDDNVTLGVKAGSAGALSVANATLSTPELLIGSAGTGKVTVGTGGIVKVTNTLTIHSGSTLTSTTGAVDIGFGLTATPGTIGVGTDGTLSGAGAVKGALHETVRGAVTAEGGELAFVGAVDGGGKLTIDDGATLYLDGSDANSVIFEGGAGILKLGHPDTLTGTIYNLQPGDVIDLVAIKATHVARSGRTVTVTEKGGATLTFQVSGALTGNRFTIAHDGQGGSNLVFGPRPPAEAPAGSDHFTFADAHQSTGPHFATIAHFNAAFDTIDLPVAVTGFGAEIASGGLSMESFNGDLAAAMDGGHLGAHQAVIFTPTSGDLAGDTFLIVDGNGRAGYQAGKDFVFRLDHPGHLDMLSAANFG